MKKKKVLCPFCNNGETGDVPSKYRAYLYGLDKHIKGTGFRCFRCDAYGHASKYYNEIGETWEDLEIVDLSSIDFDKISSFSVVGDLDNIDIYKNIKCDIFSELDMELYEEYSTSESEYIDNFLSDRKIPLKHKHLFDYTPNFLEMYKHLNNKDYKTWGFDKRIIIKYLNQRGDIYALKSRSLDKNSKIKYMTFSNSNDMFFNEYNIRHNEKVYVLEGEIDSLFIDNSIGLGSVAKAQAFLDKYINIIPKEKIYFILDNDKAGLNDSIKLLRNKYNVFSWKMLNEKYNITKFKNDDGTKKHIKDINNIAELYDINTINLNEFFINDDLMEFDLDVIYPI